MTHQFDDFSKSLAEPVPRRESLRRLGAVFAGAVLTPLGLEAAVRRTTDPCKSFCKCRNSKQQSQCLSACKACNADTTRLSGRCGAYACCGPGLTSCRSYCADLANDPFNCGACGYVCEEPGLYEYGACIDGSCEYACAEGALYCNGICTFLGSDPYNCGACGNVCPESAPFCNDGVCSVCPPGRALCGGECVDILNDPDNCGACGNVCDGLTPYCSYGECISEDEPCPGGGTWCDGVCTNVAFDTVNCGGCGIVCAPGETCSGGVCQSPW